ncbi:hypothetical protein GQ44DRAFT_777889 [Phaeosphaeriaceae sp. PMI808]|nr:hypothetical protein GQ44DRAFT_777889 [Phaeosphaeriaceae sp. PMI808]
MEVDLPPSISNTEREHAGHPGMSDTVYLFQRIWSGLISDERRAWELLSLVDQIHEWGVTTFRDYVIRHLQSWHKYCRQLWIVDAIQMRAVLGKNSTTCGQFTTFGLPRWANGFGMDFRAELKQKAGKLLIKTLMEVQAGEPSITCVVGRCGIHGYNLYSPEEFLKHFSSVHNGEIDESCRTAVNELFRHSVTNMEKLLQDLQPKGNKRSSEENNVCAEEGKQAKRTRSFI